MEKYGEMNDMEGKNLTRMPHKDLYQLKIRGVK
jgi:hypothetical protein